LQTKLAHGTVARPVKPCGRVTDLFLSGGVDYSDEHIGLSMTSSSADASHRDLPPGAALPTGWLDRYPPPLTIRGLAFDDLMRFAAPCASRSGTGSTTTR